MSPPPTTQLLLFEEPTRCRFKDRPPRGLGASILRVCVLGSGSAGNATVVQHGESVLLIDAGFGPRTTTRRLAQTGVGLGDIRAVCLTHLDRDHFNPTWLATLLRYQIKVYAHSRHLPNLYRHGLGDQLHRAGLLNMLDGYGFEPLPGLRGQTIDLPHDRTGTVGYRFDTPAGCIGYATDLGHVPDQLIHRFAGLDLLGLESNYDQQMQVDSNRPAMLKRRIMGPAGHLSNQQAFEAVQRVMDTCPRGGPGHIVLLHPSRQCNHPSLIQHLFTQDPRLASRLTLANQTHPTPWLTVRPPPRRIKKLHGAPTV